MYNEGRRKDSDPAAQLGSLYLSLALNALLLPQCMIFYYYGNYFHKLFNAIQIYTTTVIGHQQQFVRGFHSAIFSVVVICEFVPFFLALPHFLISTSVIFIVPLLCTVTPI